MIIVFCKLCVTECTLPLKAYLLEYSRLIVMYRLIHTNIYMHIEASLYDKVEFSAERLLQIYILNIDPMLLPRIVSVIRLLPNIDPLSTDSV